MDIIAEDRQSAIANVDDEGLLGDDVEQRLADSVDRWSSIVEELGYEDGGALEEIPDWFNAESHDVAPYVDRLYEDVISEHRLA